MVEVVSCDYVEVICFGCGGMVELECKVCEWMGVLVVDGVVLVVIIVEVLVCMGLKILKVWIYVLLW